MLRTSIRNTCPPRVCPDFDSVRRTNALLSRLREWVIVEKPATVHDTSHSDATAKVSDHVGDGVDVDKDPGAPCAASDEVQLTAGAELLPAEQFPDDLRQDFGSEEGKLLTRG